MKIDLNNIKANWKTSVSGLLSASVMCLIAYEALPKDASRVAYAVAIGKALIGFLQKDAGSVVATPLGESTPQVLDAHETPDVPAKVDVQGDK